MYDVPPWATTYGFRPQKPDERDGAYRTALIAYVKRKDYAASFELFLGRPQAEWTPGDVAAFKQEWLKPDGGPARRFNGPRDIIAIDYGVYPVTTAAIRELAIAAMELQMDRRVQAPRESLAPEAYVLLADGHLIYSRVDNSDDRVATVHGMANALPAVAFFLIADTFIHIVDSKDHTAAKIDAIVCHLGLRNGQRAVIAQHYTYGPDDTVTVGERVERDTSTAIQDPYDQIFEPQPSTTPKGKTH